MREDDRKRETLFFFFPFCLRSADVASDKRMRARVSVSPLELRADGRWKGFQE